jgi:TIR domain-containing protein
MPKRTATGKSYLVFISHSHKDRWIARQIVGLIASKGHRHGVETFLDEKDIEGGDSIAQSVLKSIQGCNEFLVLLTRNSIGRPWVLIEIGAAWAMEK